MGREYAIVTSKFWTGETGKSLRKEPDAQRVAFYLITAPTSNMIGLYYLPLPTLCHEVGMTLQGALKALRRVSELGFAHFDADSEWVWVPAMASFQLGEKLKPKDKRITGVVNLLRDARKSPYIKSFVDKYGASFSLPPIDFHEAPSKPHRSQDQDQDQDQEGDTPLPPSRKGRRGFVKPTVEEISAYCEERSNGIPAQAFFDHYETNGWVQGRSSKPVVDWKACVRTWEAQRKSGSNGGRGSPMFDRDDPYGNHAAGDAFLESLKQ